MKRLIQVGVGGMGAVWTGQVAESDEWEAAAYVDIDEKNLVAAAARHGMPKARCYTSLNQALYETEADALLDVTPQAFRKQTCLDAFKRGLHVMSEKPLADSMRNAQSLISQAQKYGCIFMVAQNYRYTPIAQTARRFIETGKLGDIGYINIIFQKGPHFGGYREKMAYPLILDMSIHHLDLMRFLLNSDVSAVQALNVKTPWNWFKGDAGVMANIEMQNGVTANYTASWISTGWETPWNGHWRIEGEKGCLIWENDVLYFSDHPERRRKIPVPKTTRTSQSHLLDVFANAIIRNEEPETSGRQNLNSLATTFALVQAVKKKERILLSNVSG